VEGSVERFQREREEGNRRVSEAGNLTLNRFFALDHRAYEEGALPARTKELLGLAASMVLRCDDCIRYHLLRCREEGVALEELREALAVSLVVGGSIVIPHLRRALAFLDEIEAGATPAGG
jgi:AhpD family alkylhydroperoxidase